MDLSIVIPIKDERDNLVRLRDRLVAALEPTRRSFEVLLVDDGSTDGSWNLLQEIAAADPRIKVLRLKRNFGQSAALQAGIDHSLGDVVVTLDGDLQNDPADIPMLLERLAEGHDAVVGLRARRQDHFLIRKVPSLAANWLIRTVTGTRLRDMGCTLRALRGDLARSLSLYGEMHRFLSILIQQTGADVLQVPVNHHPRTAGKTKYTLSRTFRVLLDLITVKFLQSYLTRPMHMMGTAGLASLFLAFFSLCGTCWMKWVGGIDMTGNPLLLLTVLLSFLGVQFFSLGLIGELMTRTYFESQGKRVYVVGDSLNLTPQSERKAA